MEQNKVSSSIEKEVKPKRLNLSKDNRAGLLNARSNFVPQIKTVVVTNKSIVPDSPEKSKLSGSSIHATDHISSLRRLGSQHFSKFNSMGAKGINTKTTQNVDKTHHSAKSQFLLGNETSKTSVMSESGRVHEKANPSSMLKQIALNAHKATFPKQQPQIQSNPTNIAVQKQHPPVTISGFSSLSAKVRAKAQQQATSNPPADAANPLPAVPIAASSTAHSSPVVPRLPSNTATVHQLSTSESTAAASASVPTASSAASGGGGLSAMLTSLGKSLQPGSRGTANALTRTMRPSAGMLRSALSQEYAPPGSDMGVYDAHHCDAAQTVGHYLDSVISTTAATTTASTVTSNKTAVSFESDNTNSHSINADTVAAVDTTTSASSSSAQKPEKADSFSNFVRKNLKSGGSSKKLNRSSSRVSMAKQRWINRSAEQGGGQGSRGGKYSKYGKNAYQSARKGGESTDENRGGGAAYSQPRGLQQWGLDSLEMSLDYLAPPSSEELAPVPIDETDLVDSDCELEIQTTVAITTATVVDSAAETEIDTMHNSSTVKVNGSSCTNGTIEHLHATTAHTHQTSCPAHNVAERAHKLRQALTATLPASQRRAAKTCTADKVAERAAVRQRENERIAAMSALAPKCPGHSMAAKLLVVKKSGPNKGRYFYSCTYPAEQRCNFFMWAEDSPELLKHSAAAGSIARSSTAHSVSTELSDPHEAAQQAKLLYTTQSYAARLWGMNREELKQEVARCNRRNALCGVPVKIGVSGTKEELVECLLHEAIATLAAGDGERGLEEEEEVLPTVTKGKPPLKTQRPSPRPVRATTTATAAAERPPRSTRLSTESSGRTGGGTYSEDNPKQETLHQAKVATEVEEFASRETGNEEDEGKVECSESDDAEEEEEEEVVVEEEEEEGEYFSDEGSVVVGAAVDCSLSSDTGSEAGSVDELGTSDAEMVGGSDSASDTDCSSSKDEKSVLHRGKQTSNTTAATVRRKVGQAGDSSEKDDETSEAKTKRARTDTASRARLDADLDPLDILLRRNFGFSEFRPGQRWAIQRCLAGLSSLLVLPTGAGKSLCYMLPALALPGLTLVVSPLVALMQDQQRKLPFGLPGACLSGSLTAQQIMEISEAVLKGHIRVLYVSPERLCTPAFRRLVSLLKQQQHYSSPHTQHAAVVSLMCVDEAHCLSQWSYNFRPAFLRIRREIQFIQPASVLALTATATPRIQVDVMRHLGIPTKDGLLALPVRRDNLQVSVYTIANEEDRRKRIVDLVKTPQILETDANRETAGDDSAECLGRKRSRDAVRKNDAKKLTIVYVWRRFEADALAEFLKGSGVTGVAVYHAGIDAATRARTQLMFDRGQVRCIVATVAFGMGVDKADVRQVVHCTMPKSIESYMQEIGRAGRDGLPSACHLMLHREDAVLQHSLSHSMQLSRIQIAALLMKVFQLNSADTVQTGPGIRQYMAHCPLKTEISLLLEPLEAAIDISSTVVETVMSVLELPPYSLLAIEGTHYDTVKGRFRSTATEALAQEDVLVAALIAVNTYKPPKASTDFDFLLTASGKSSHGAGEGYGLGFDSSASATNRGAEDGQESAWQRDRRLGGAYGGKILEFECSRLAVALHCQLTPEEVSTGLYKLQKAGVLEYKLQDSALYIHTHSARVGEHHFTHYCADKGCVGSVVADYKQLQAHYYGWLWRLSGAVQESLHTIAAGGSSRIVDMWRATHTISCFTAQASKSVERASVEAGEVTDVTASGTVPHCTPAAVHSAAQSLLSYVMSDADSSSSDNNSSAVTTTAAVPVSGSEVDSLSAAMLDMYLTSPGPFSVSLLGSTATTSSSKESSATANAAKLREQVRDTAMVLQRDPTVMTGANCILKSCLPVLAHHNSQQHRDSANSTDTSVVYAKKALVSLCICRILHALPTKLFPTGVWRDRSEAWGSCRHVQFDELFEYVLNVLLAKE